MTEAVPQDTHSSLLERKIIHIDMDAFYASVEVRDQPDLRGKPVIVGGSPTGRGVVATCSYEARRFGIHSAMPSAAAVRRCPHAVFLQPRFEVYVSISKQIRTIFQRYSTMIQPLSLDEAFLDVTSSGAASSATDIAKQIRRDIESELRLTASAGVAPNKMLAKIASDMNKPNGLTIVRPEQAASFMWNLPVRKIPGVGPKTAERLAAIGLVLCRDVLSMNHASLMKELNDFGLWLVERCKGIDERPVAMSSQRKSLGKERTFGRDLTSFDEMLAKLREIADHLGQSLKHKSARGKTITLKVRYHGFETITRAKTLSQPVNAPDDLYAISSALLAKTQAPHRPVRLLGISVTNLEGDIESSQLSLFC